MASSAYAQTNASKIGKLTFDPSGDVLLIIPYINSLTKHKNDHKTAHFLVSSSILRTVSPVFRAMFSHNFKEGALLSTASTASMTAVPIQLEDDDPPALAIALYIAHHQLHRVPKSLSWEQLYQLALIFDKYDLSPGMREQLQLRTKFDTWAVATVPEPSNNWSKVAGVPLKSALFVSYVFRLEVVFTRVTHWILLHARLELAGKKNDRLVLPNGQNATVEALPTSIYNTLKKKREENVSKLFNEASTLLKQYYSGGDSLNKKHIVCKHNPSSATCDSVILGCLIHFYISKGLYTLKDTWNWTPGIDLRGLQGLHAQLSTLNIPFAYCEETKGCCDKPVKATNTTTSHSSLGYHSSRSPYCNNCGGYHGCNNNSTCSSCQRPFAERKLSIDHKACLPTSGFLERINNILKSVKGLRLADYKSAGLGNEQEGQEEPLWDCIKFV